MSQLTLALVGHCGPDSFMLRSSVSTAVRNARISMIQDQSALDRAIQEGVRVMLVNRLLDGGFDVDHGVDLIRRYRSTHPQVQWLLISNFADAQLAAEQAGALPGFGKREIGSARMKEALARAIETTSPSR